MVIDCNRRMQRQAIVSFPSRDRWHAQWPISLFACSLGRGGREPAAEDWSVGCFVTGGIASGSGEGRKRVAARRERVEASKQAQTTIVSTVTPS